MTITTFSFTTVGTSSWTVPNYTGLITIEAIGGAGGACVGMSVGGGGARLAGTCTLSPGTVLTVIAGEGGSDSWNEAGGARRGGAGGGPTGWNGGDGGDGTGSWIYGTGWPGGGGGGGASAVDTSAGLLIVAAGGGGGGNSGFGSGDNGHNANIGPFVSSGHPGRNGGSRGGGGGGGLLGGDLSGGAGAGGQNYMDTGRMTATSAPSGFTGVKITLDVIEHRPRTSVGILVARARSAGVSSS